VYNPYLVTPLAVWAIAQVVKFALAAFKGRIDFKNLYASGGMPSVHSAVVTSLAVTALLVDGAGSHLFGFTAVFAVIVMYDSLGVRRAAGEQAVALNILIAEAGKNHTIGRKPLREVLGHSPLEVLVGAVMGAVLSCVFAYDRLGAFGTFLSTTPKPSEYTLYGIAGLILIVVGLLVRVILPMFKKDSKAIRNLAKALFKIIEGAGWFTLLAALLEYEQASYLAWRIWPLVTLITAGIMLIITAIGWARRLPEVLAIEAETARKSKWFSWGKNKKKSRSKKA
jgi:acid phosphatase family membrane protein YuiD